MKSSGSVLAPTAAGTPYHQMPRHAFEGTDEFDRNPAGCHPSPPVRAADVAPPDPGGPVRPAARHVRRILSSTVVSNALPVIVSDLKGTESGYTWVIAATLLATTISTPIWGKLADLFSKKILVQIALVIFVAASALAGLSQNMAMLITTRVLQALGAGGLT